MVAASADSTSKEVLSMMRNAPSVLSRENLWLDDLISGLMTSSLA
jgi:hypothetical protein